MNESDKEGELVFFVLRGLPRSGKSTIAKERSERTGAVVISRDSIRLALHGKPYVAELEDEVSNIERLMIQSLFYSGCRTIILDECFVKRASIKHTLDYLTGSIPYSFTTKTVQVPVEVCIRRAISCDQEYLVPVILDMAKRFD